MSSTNGTADVEPKYHLRKDPMPDEALVSVQEAIDWMERAPCGAEVRIEKQSGRRYHVKRRKPVD